MMSAPTSPPGSVLPGYALREPNEDDARAALERVFGAERGAAHWSAACLAAGLAPGAVASREALETVCRALAGRGGACVAVARSVEIRLRTHARLAANLRAGGAA